ncbi:phage/plasmid primase, P4 family [Streptomyces sp. NPDC093084]|uniref:phage/plasmid primase, P4 family n=1 Tax=Streptomyces sp. NPDC093084 TaxID=3155197 RepID=UPI00341E8035
METPILDLSQSATEQALSLLDWVHKSAVEADGYVCIAHNTPLWRQTSEDTAERELGDFTQYFLQWPQDRQRVPEGALFTSVFSPNLAQAREVWFSVCSFPVRTGVDPERTSLGWRAARLAELSLPTDMVWCDIDHAAENWTAEQLAEIDEWVTKRGGAVVRSGSGDNRHVYLKLSRTVPREVTERLNLQLAAKFRGDTSKANTSSVLRLPGTFNHKRREPSPVLLAVAPDPSHPGLDPDELSAELPEPARASFDRSAPEGEFAECLYADGTSYGLAVLRDELSKLAGTGGERNVQIFRSGANLGNLVAGGELNRDYAYGQLRDVALEIGDNPGLDEATAHRGFTTGLKSPRNAPQLSEADRAVRERLVERSHVPIKKKEAPMATPALTSVTTPPGEVKQLPQKSILWGHEHTDLGNGRRLRDLYGQDLRHAPGWGWLTWDGRRWTRDEGQARRFMHDVVDEIAMAIADLPEQVRGDDLMKWFSGTSSRNGISAALNEASVMLPIAAETSDFDRDPYKLLVGNGVVDLRAGQLSPFHREDMLTRGTTVEYDPHTECPMWLDFLGWAFQGDVEMIGYVQRMFGMCLLGNNAHQVAFFLYGPGRSGKSTMTRVLAWLLGDYAVSADLSVFNEASGGHNEPLARLAGARLVIFSETRAGQRINEAQFKKFTGEDTLTASFKNKSVFDFVPAFTPVMFGNAQPSIAFDSGVERRMKVVPMKAKITDAQKDPKLFERLTLNEGPAIMAWAVRGAQLAAAEAFVPDPPQVADAVKVYKQDNDHMGQFVEECLVFADGATAASELVWARYVRWVQAGGTDFVKKADDAGKSLLVRMLKTWSVENGTPVETFKSSNTRKVRGVTLASEHKA